MPLITTLMPVYNGEPHIGEALASLASQSRRPDRVVILDNCSTDRTHEIVTGCKALACEYHLNETNVGLFGNHNRALEFARETDYLHLLHTDDVLLPGFLARSLELLEGVAGRAMSWCQADTIDETGQSIPSIVNPRPGPPEQVPLDDFLKERARFRADIFVSGTLFKTNREPMPSKFPEEFKQVGDQLFWAQWASNCARRIRIREVLLKYRSHPLSNSVLNQANLQAFVFDDWQVIEAIEAMRGKHGPHKWLRRQQLKCFHAAMMQGKIQLIRARSPEYARQAGRAARSQVSALHWLLGKGAVLLRKTYRRFAA